MNVIGPHVDLIIQNTSFQKENYIIIFVGVLISVRTKHSRVHNINKGRLKIRYELTILNQRYLWYTGKEVVRFGHFESRECGFSNFGCTIRN